MTCQLFLDGKSVLTALLLIAVCPLDRQHKGKLAQRESAGAHRHAADWQLGAEATMAGYCCNSLSAKQAERDKAPKIGANEL